MAIEFKKINGDSAGYFAVVLVFAAVVAIGVLSYLANHFGSAPDDMSQRVPWGIVNGAIPYYIGLSAGSLILSALAGVFNIKKYKVFSRMAAFLAIAWIVVAILSIVMDIGKPLHLGGATLYFNLTSIFSWNAFLYSSYFVVCAIYLIAMFEDKQTATRILAGVAVFWAVMVHSGTGAIYGFIYSRELYHSALLAPLFIICATSSGLGLLMATIYLTFKYTGRKLDPDLVRSLSKVFLGLILILAYFLVVEMFEKSYMPGLQKATHFVFLNPSQSIFWCFWLLLIVGIGVPAFIVAYPRTGRDLRWLGIGGIIHAAMIYAERFYLIVPGEVFPREYLPGYAMTSLNTLEGSIVSYTPTPIEWAQVIGLFAIGYLIFLIGLKVFAILPEEATEEVTKEVVEE